jgi:hypothetical protein
VTKQACAWSSLEPLTLHCTPLPQCTSSYKDHNLVASHTRNAKDRLETTNCSPGLCGKLPGCHMPMLSPWMCPFHLLENEISFHQHGTTDLLNTLGRTKQELRKGRVEGEG